ncbi:hypothetical protein GQ54DRAFT_168346 [Martensiomyces pterosporus]|nr:hypothetical protein GQ54DRAFT_168346 [Martensiomyces pterosporus]
MLPHFRTAAARVKSAPGWEAHGTRIQSTLMRTYSIVARMCRGRGARGPPRYQHSSRIECGCAVWFPACPGGRGDARLPHALPQTSHPICLGGGYALVTHDALTAVTWQPNEGSQADAFATRCSASEKQRKAAKPAKSSIKQHKAAASSVLPGNKQRAAPWRGDRPLTPPPWSWTAVVADLMRRTRKGRDIRTGCFGSAEQDWGSARQEISTISERRRRDAKCGCWHHLPAADWAGLLPILRAALRDAAGLVG